MTQLTVTRSAYATSRDQTRPTFIAKRRSASGRDVKPGFTVPELSLILANAVHVFFVA